MPSSPEERLATVKRARLKDVADLAGTSIATASRVLSGSNLVSEETRQGILAAAKMLNYQPNLHARNLRRRSTHSIGLLIPSLMDAYYTALADTLDQMLAERQYRLLLASTRDDPASERQLLSDMIGQDVDGLIWAPCAPTPDMLERLNNLRTCVIAIVRRVPGDAVDTVVFEDMADSKAAVQHLINLGHPRIAYIGPDLRHSCNADRFQGYLAALQEAGLASDNSLIKLGPDRSTWGVVATDDLLRLAAPPSAIFVASNAIMPGVLKTLRLNGISIPEQMSLVCFDDLDWFSFSVPPITAVSVSHTRLASIALDLLFARMEHSIPDRPQPALVRIGCDLVLRGSTAPYRRPAAPK